MHVAQAKRTLIDLIHTEHGCARIFFGQDSYSYELFAYQPRPVADLFERMAGYESAPDACEAARQQLSAVSPQSGSKGRKATSRINRSVPAQRAVRRPRVARSIGLL